MRTIVFFLFTVILSAMTLFAQVHNSTLNPIKNPSLEELRQTFKNPPREYSTGPLWVWNDMLTEEQIRSTLRDLAGQRVKQVWVHPRPGLMTPYLSDEWFRLWNIALDEAEKLDMNVWIYDENSYPSGFAGGLVPDAMPESRGMGLQFEEAASLDKIDENVWYVFAPDSNSPTGFSLLYVSPLHLRGIMSSGKLPPLDSGQKYLLGKIQYTVGGGGWFGGKWYVDLLRKGVTEKFIEITHEAYKKHVGDQFGKRLPGIFTDEAHLAAPYTGTWVTWNEEIPERFEKKFGYSLIDSLPSLHKPIGDWKKVRHNYFSLLLELFVERWSKPTSEWCEQNGLEWTGHYIEHAWPNVTYGPDNMAMYIWHQRPGIDLLMNAYDDKSPNAQFGNVRVGKELSSIANQMGRSRTFSENYGAAGWELRFEDMKRLGDWSYALGVNTLNEHLSFVTIRGARKRDHPQSFSYHASWFEGYHALADYFTRLSYVLSQGRQINRIVVIEPTTTAWMYQGEPKQGEIGKSFTDFVNLLERAQVEYDLASEDTIARLGKVADKKFSIHLGEYDLVILPPNMENLNSRTAELLAQYVKDGGKLLCAGEFPVRCDGVEPGGVEAQWLQQIRTPSLGVNVLTESGGFNPEWVARLTDVPNVRQCKPNEIVPLIFDDRDFGDSVMALSVDRDSEGKIFHHRRTLPDCTILFLCNVSQKETASGAMLFGNDLMLEEWDLMTGTMTPVILPFMLQKREHDPNVFPSYSTLPSYRYEIPPSGSRLLVLWKTSEILTNRPVANVQIQTNTLPGTDTTVKRLEPNVLVLDYVDVKAGGEERKGIFTFAANRWIFEKHGTRVTTRSGQPFFGNPWDFAVQFKDELITKTYPENSGFEAVYRFVVEETADGRRQTAADIAIVIERADLYTVYCNGERIKEPGTTSPDWWLDRSFGKIDISPFVQPGENMVKIVAKPMTIYHELEPAYLLGDFSLRFAEKGFIVCPPQPLSLTTTAAAQSTQHSDLLEGVSWLSVGVDFQSNAPDRSPSLVFELPEEQQIAAVRIWNYNERSLQKRGVKSVEITGLGKVELPIGTGFAKDIPFTAPTTLKTVEFKILSNHAGTTYPIADNVEPNDNGFVGLSEVQFLVRNKENQLVPVKNVTVKASSELTAGYDRKARYLVDGSGLAQNTLEQGWHRQGMPFYAGKVEYSRSFKIEKVEGKYSVQLPKSQGGWYGATARIMVNGNNAGYVVSAPWSVEVTQFIKSGKNEVSVQVYGTPKNLLGPHHAGKVRGSAWTGTFQRAPDKQPAGVAYDVIGYGLFEPFTLQHRAP